QIYLSAIYGIVPDEMVRTIAAFLEACYITRRDTINEEDIAQFHDTCSRFYKHQKVFQETGVCLDGFSLPWQHSLDHYDQHMMNFGAPNGLCTSITEAKHIKAVKEPWRRSNRFEPLGQMLLTNQRLDKLAAARADFTAQGMLSSTCLGMVLAALQAEADERRGLTEEEPDMDDTGTQPDNNATSHEDSGVVHGPRRGYPHTVKDLGCRIGVENLTTLVSRFLFQQMLPDEPLPEDDTFLPPLLGSMRIRIYHSAIATFYAPSDPSGVGGMHRKYIRATPSWQKGPPRYDCVFVGKDASLDGFRGLHAARVWTFFPILVPCLDGSDGDEWVPCVLVEWFSAVGDEPDEVTGLWKVEPDYFEDGRRMRDVIHVESLL
ncbi:hypothetical protein C8T65DRAFT_519149, partial [Cerioporus squamosus]